MIDSHRLEKTLYDWKDARKIIGIGRDLQHQYRCAGILEWTPLGVGETKPLVRYTWEQLMAFAHYLSEKPQEARLKLLEWRKSHKRIPRKRR